VYTWCSLRSRGRRREKKEEKEEELKKTWTSEKEVLLF